ncbi:hypothetical protein HanRHA438_Chr14g0632361 [Helianthus annuus]|uniref:Uncharacterized protein n=2 Tax=Helianthus annuus TaxID=4232 RepID=A0A251SDF4_HELAN|nr:hypothetical protein HanXRQr2_Chr14g0622401 [Helianthus annuus]KAJ0462861.1 hypothetical protein HanHA300_Chr14g0508751 [Helianthus annuus]KAJ0484207.1 hypothetical protein HanHA89_Chr14g0541531 [Helianthus annuus]KAJ0654764.1 hypothetical protein HanLR1_Chr14g0510801 [Helianthus annuus]KAJ0658508.1 hypothetical protein HanOQP8_Chr14g0509011 [Helianthus annuus]
MMIMILMMRSAAERQKDSSEYDDDFRGGGTFFPTSFVLRFWFRVNRVNIASDWSNRVDSIRVSRLS